MDPNTEPERPGTTRLPDLLALAVHNAHVAVGVGRLADGVLLAANDAFCRLFGHPRETIVGRRSSEFDVWPEPAQRDRMMALLRQHGSVSGHELRYRTPGGEEGWLRASMAIVHAAGADYLVGFFSEATAEREVMECLQSTQARLRVALRATELLVFRQDADLRYTWVAKPVLGASESDVLGRTDDEILGTEAAAPLVAIKRRVLQTGQAERRDVWVANNGQLGCFDMVVEPERDATGRVVAIVCAAQDVTRHKTSAEGAAERREARQLHRGIQGMAALIAREPLMQGQRERLRRIQRETRLLSVQLRTRSGQRDGPPAGAAAGWALQQLREHHAGTRVLVAEANPVVRELLTGILESAGLRVEQARTGVEAFSLGVQLRPALVLLDMELPQRGAVAAARAMRTMLHHRMPIIAMMSAEPLVDASLALEADLDDVIDKPASGDELCEAVLAWLQA